MRSGTKLATAGVAALAIATPFTPSASSTHATGHGQIQHVLLISVDGMHQSDLDWYVANHPNSELGRLATGGAEYTDAQTSDPSDSDPGGTALMTGGDPKVTGIYYDDEYSHGVFPPGTTSCSGPVPGGDVIYDSPDDNLPAVPDLMNNGSGNTFPSFDEGGSIYSGGKDTNPALIMNLSPHPQSGLNPATYPVDPATCQPIQPAPAVGSEPGDIPGRSGDLPADSTMGFPGGEHDLPGDPQLRHANGVVRQACDLHVVQRPGLERHEH